MAKFRITASEMVYYEADVEAENEQEAMDKAWTDSDGNIDWYQYDSSDYQIDGATEIEGE